MSAMRWVALVTGSLVIGGCGLSVPEIQEIPGDTADGHKLVQEIARNITCELGDAVHAVYRHNKTTFLDNWGVQMTLTLTVEETGTLGPNANWLPPSPANAIFNLNVGASASTDATRTDIINLYYAVSQLRKGQTCNPRENGPFLLESDLKLKEWLFDALNIDEDGTAYQDVVNSPQNVISHEVKFEIMTGGSASPGWVLSRVQVNQTGTLASVNRDRIHDLLITFGPPASSVPGAMAMVSGLSQPALNAHFASQIGLAISNNIRSSLRP
jgi:hypothetical protein